MVARRQSWTSGASPKSRSRRSGARSASGPGHQRPQRAAWTALSVTVLGAPRAGRAAQDGLHRQRPDLREGEPQCVVADVREHGESPSSWWNAKESSSGALAGLTDPEEKRQAITDTFYSKVFAPGSSSQSRRQVPAARHHPDRHRRDRGRHQEAAQILSQLGIDTKEAYGYAVVEPLKTLRKDDVRAVAQPFLELPAEISPPAFPSRVRPWRPASSARSPRERSDHHPQGKRPPSSRRNWPIPGLFSTWPSC